MFNSLFGFPINVNPNMSAGQIAMNNNASQYQNNGMANAGHSQTMLAQQAAAWNAAVSGLGQSMQSAQHRYMINGKTMTFDQFLDELCPESDDPMRTFLILKYKDTR